MTATGRDSTTERFFYLFRRSWLSISTDMTSHSEVVSLELGTLTSLSPASAVCEKVGEPWAHLA